MKHILASRLLFLIAFGYTLGLLTLSLIKIEEEELPVNFEFADKIFHLGAYGLLTLLWHIYFFNKKKKKKYPPNLWICSAAVIFGIVIEFIQENLTAYRGLEVLDMVANTMGVALAFGFLLLFDYINERKKWI